MSRELKTPPNPHVQVDHLPTVDKYDYITKVIIIGDAGVGKSSILKMFTEYSFDKNPISTMGIDFQVAFMKITHLDESNQQTNDHEYDIGKYLTITENNESTGLRKQIKHPVFKFQVWDCAGQERFHSIVKSYIRGAHVVIYAFDITDQHSFATLNKWRQSVEDEIGTPDDGKYMCVVVGNKLDMEKHRQIAQEDARKFASSMNTVYAEVSAKDDTNIQRMFEEITRIIYCKLLNGDLKMDHKSMLPTHMSITTTSPLNDEPSIDKCLPGRCVIL